MTNGRTDRGHFIISRTGPIGRREIIIPNIAVITDDSVKLNYIPYGPFTQQVVHPAVTGVPPAAKPPPRLSHFIRVVHTTGGVIRGYRHLANPPILQLPFKVCM